LLSAVSHSMPLGIGYSFHGFVDVIEHEVLGIRFHCSSTPYVTRHMGVSRAPVLGAWWMKRDQDSSRLRVILVSLESLLRFGSARLSLVRRRNISPGLSLAREILAIQTTGPPLSTSPLRVFCNSTTVPFVHTFH